MHALESKESRRGEEARIAVTVRARKRDSLRRYTRLMNNERNFDVAPREKRLARNNR